MPLTDDAMPAPVYDRARALRNLENSDDLLREVTEIFLADYRDDLDTMRRALMIGDAGTLFRLAHTLKGSMSTFCADTGFEAAKLLVQQSKDGDLHAAADQFTLVEQLTEELAAALRAEP